jgi:hypothetical protein
MIGNNAFPRQQWLGKHASMLHYMYIAHLHLSEARQPPEDEGRKFFSNTRKKKSTLHSLKTQKTTII